MRVVALPSDYGGVSHYRLLSVIPHLPEDVEVSVLEGFDVEFNSARTLVRRVPSFSGADLIVWHRPLAWWGPQAIAMWQEQGIRVVVDLDDNYHAVGPANLAYYQTHPALSSKNWKHLGECVRIADLVTVSTAELALRYGRGRAPCVVLRNMIDGAWLDIRRDPDFRVVGWTGTLMNHRGDLRATDGGVAQALERAGGRFRVIGSPKGVREELGLAEEPQSVPWQAMESYPREIAKLTVGIAPLADSAVNRSKSWNKPLEYAACGVPAVMSPMPEYELLSEAGIGLVASGRRSWRRLVEMLLDGPVREEMIELGRERAADLTIQKNGWRWAEAWESALMVRR